MKLAGLSLEQAPPFSVPMRFFLTAPVFGMFISVLMFTQGSVVVGSRWYTAVIAGTHLFVLGFAATVMFGAIQQMLPVVAGASVPHPRRYGGLVHILWTLGVLSLTIGFLTNSKSALSAAVGFLVLGSSAFLLLSFVSLFRAQSSGPTVHAIFFSLIALAITIGAGVVLVAGYLGWLPLFRLRLTNLHVTWGLLGWIGFLIIGVSYQIVPMFHITPSYPQRLTRWLVPGLTLVFLLRSLATWWVGKLPALSHLQLGLDLLIAIGFILFAVTTLYLQAQRKRKIKDVSLWFWRIGMFHLLLVACLGISGLFIPPWQSLPIFAMLIGLLYLFGFVFPVMLAMLCKIVGFLVWFQLQGKQTSRMMQGLPPIKLPNMKEAIPDTRLSILFFLYVLSFGLLLGSLWFPFWVFYLAAASLFAVFVFLGWSLLSAGLLYRRTCLLLQAKQE